MKKRKGSKYVKVRTPGGRVKLHLRRKKPSKAKCALCKKPLTGVSYGRQAYIRKLSKSERIPERPYGGNLCSECMRNTIKEKVRDLILESMQ